ncbi:trypsin-like serine protease [Haloechinothrix sp. YIM 98757]|uniref:Trypsin-like serine protease n=1 Tax=Haloechinothrix aidingensis TaxID=2752311 RepID=A0A838ACN3_9PSEU|nr:trypsin-like serine protease [Haloechinothrix aidingensis]MBA0127000.1 trypsin-like serine protease [Haloechinothrix aidingensis]
MRKIRLALAATAASLALLAAGPVAAAASAPEATPAGAEPLIIDGGYADEAPWAARMFVDGDERCSASIIAPTWILTADHCVGRGEHTFRIGSTDQHSGGTMATGVDIHTHYFADIALVELDRPVDTAYAELADSSGDVRVGDTAQVYGWGATCTDRPERECQSRYLKYANVDVTSTNCRDAGWGTAICAQRGDGIPAGGDSGGPMFNDDVQVGVASTSDRRSRTAYTSVIEYRDWIRSVSGV